jgi:raffinose/stachyose/melibiose transport system substrate-binding protein
MPAPRGRATLITFHPDMAITYNTMSKHLQECKDFLAWLATRDGATTASENLPLGFFPMINFPIQLTDPHANEFLALNNGKDTDARFVWPKFLELYAPMNQAVIQVIKKEISPRQAADAMERAVAAQR